MYNEIKQYKTSRAWEILDRHHSESCYQSFHVQWIQWSMMCCYQLSWCQSNPVSAGLLAMVSMVHIVSTACYCCKMSASVQMRIGSRVSLNPGGSPHISRGNAGSSAWKRKNRALESSNLRKLMTEFMVYLLGQGGTSGTSFLLIFSLSVLYLIHPPG